MKINRKLIVNYIDYQVVGVLELKSDKEAVIETIRLDVYRVAKGKTGGDMERVDEFAVSHSQITLKPGQAHEIPFKFDTDGYMYDYDGKNIQIKHLAVLKMELEDGVVYNLEQCYFEVKPKEKIEYKITTKNPNFKLMPNIITFIMALIICLLLYIPVVIKFNLSINLFHLAIVFPYLIIFLKINSIRTKLLGELQIRFESSSGEFQCIFQNKRAVKIKDISVQYSIKERVIDNRGSSTISYTDKLYKSPVQKLKRNENSVTFDFPENRNYLSFELGKHIGVSWEVIITGKNKGFKEMYVGEITTDRIG